MPPELVTAWMQFFKSKFEHLKVVCFTSFPKDENERKKDPSKGIELLNTVSTRLMPIAIVCSQSRIILYEMQWPNSLVFSVLDSRSRSPCVSPGWGDYTVFLGKSGYSHSNLQKRSSDFNFGPKMFRVQYKTLK